MKEVSKIDTNRVFEKLKVLKTENAYWNNISLLRNCPEQKVFDKCVELINSKDENERKIGVNVLAQLGVTTRPFLKESIILFFELLQKEKEPKLIMTILYAIGHNNSRLKKKEIDILCSFQNTTNEYIKQGLVFSLLAIENSKAINTLIYLSKDKLNHIRDWATFGLGTQIQSKSKKICDALWERVNDEDIETKLEAMLGLAKRKDYRIKQFLLEELDKGEYSIVLFESFEELNDKETISSLKARYKKENETKDEQWLLYLKDCINNLNKSTKTNA